MSRRMRKSKPLIYVFCEGESEQAYTDFLKYSFSDVAVIKRPSSTGLFEEAISKFRKDKRYRDSVEVTDEIWFFFDVELKDVENWGKRLEAIKSLRKLRKNPNIRVRLLMTTGCIEYWLLLHYYMLSPPILTVSDKERILAKVISEEPTYKKGDYDATAKIAINYQKAINNARRTVQNLIPVGLPGMEDTDVRNQWLHTECKTFSTVYEAIEYLEELST